MESWAPPASFSCSQLDGFSPRGKLAHNAPGVRSYASALLSESVMTIGMPATLSGSVGTPVPARPEQRTRRWLQICGFFSGGDGGVTYWRKRTFRRGENIALDNARHFVGKIVADAEKLAAAERAAERRNARKPIAT